MFLVFAALAIIGLGTLAGVMAAVGFVLGPYWLSLEASSFRACFGATGAFILELLPFVLVPAIVGLVGTIWMTLDAESHVRELWALSGGCLVVVMVMTRLWFFPLNDRLLSGEWSPEMTQQKMALWLRVHHARVALLLVSCAAGLVALWQR